MIDHAGLVTTVPIESCLWGAATLLRGLFDAGASIRFIFPLLFVTRLRTTCDRQLETERPALTHPANGAVLAVGKDRRLPDGHRRLEAATESKSEPGPPHGSGRAGSNMGDGGLHMGRRGGRRSRVHTTSQVEESVGELMAVNLNEVHLARVRSGGARWRVTLRWAGYHIREEGLLVDPSPREVWEITEEGRAYLGRIAGRLWRIDGRHRSCQQGVHREGLRAQQERPLRDRRRAGAGVAASRRPPGRHH